jgi:hypothetical protein
MMMAIIAYRITRCDYLGGKGFSLSSLCQPVMAEREIGKELKNIEPVIGHAA